MLFSRGNALKKRDDWNPEIRDLACMVHTKLSSLHERNWVTIWLMGPNQRVIFNHVIWFRRSYGGNKCWFTKHVTVWKYPQRQKCQICPAVQMAVFKTKWASLTKQLHQSLFWTKPARCEQTLSHKIFAFLQMYLF